LKESLELIITLPYQCLKLSYPIKELGASLVGSEEDVVECDVEVVLYPLDHESITMTDEVMVLVRTCRNETKIAEKESFGLKVSMIKWGGSCTLNAVLPCIVLPEFLFFPVLSFLNCRPSRCCP
jgi:hypothetical protein